MKHIFIFTRECRAAEYGIGTYIRQALNILTLVDDVIFTLIYLNSTKEEVEIEPREGYWVYYFPSSSKVKDSYSSKYYRNIFFLLRSYLMQITDGEFIFSFNYHQDYPLVSLIKEYFRKSTVIFTIHYQVWASLIDGNLSYLDNIVKKSRANISDSLELKVYDSFMDDMRLYNKVDKIICLSCYTYNLLLNFYQLPSQKLFLIHNGLKNGKKVLSPKEVIQLKKKFFFSPNERIILFVGRLDISKGVDVLIKAFKIVVKRHPECHLIIVGDGNYSLCYQECEDYWRKIHLTGKLNKDKLYQLYQIANIGILPSLNEQCSYCIIEMMMFKLPIIVSSSTGLKEMIAAKECIVNVIEKERKSILSPKKLAASMLKLLANDKVRLIGNNNYNSYMEKYQLNNMLQQIVNCYSLNFKLNV